MIHQDFLYLAAPTKEELRRQTKQILKKLSEAGVTIKKDKCELNCDELSYLGYQISKDGISLDERLTKKIAEISTRRNKEKLESFFELTTFYSKYLPKYSDLIEPFAKKQIQLDSTKNYRFWNIEKSTDKKKKEEIKIFDPKKK